MSKLKTNTIRHVDGSNDNITLDSSQNVTVEGVLKTDSLRHTGASSDAVTLASDGTCTAKITNNLSNRNLIINGAMLVAQRGTSSTAGGYKVLDRWYVSYGGQDETPTIAQADVASGTTPYNLGFRKCLKVTNGNQTSGAEAGDYSEIMYQVEAQDAANSGWNYTSASSYVTLSFWVKSSVAQNFYGFFLTRDGTLRNYPFETGALSANTWTKITKTIPGDSNITFNNDNGKGITLAILPFYGTTYTNNSSTVNTWMNYSGTAYCPDNTSTWWTTNDATFEITGVQLEVGDVATDFEHRSYGDELARCMRYFEGIYMGSGTALFKSYTYGSDKVASYDFKVEKRASPTIALAGNAAWSGATPTMYPSKTTVLMQHSSTDFFLGDANGDLCLTISSEL